MMRPSTDHHRQQLKGIVAHAVAEVGGTRAAAAICGVSEGLISRFMAEHEGDRHMRLDLAADLDLWRMRSGARPPIASGLALLLGCELKPLAQGGGGGVVLSDMARLCAEFSDVQRSLFAALADGHLTPRERGDLLKELRELRGELDAIERKLMSEDA